jgi:hypothetical protein
MMISFAFASLALALHAEPDPSVGGKASAAARLARAETEACLATCPAIPAQPDSDWLRTAEGRKANGCPMACKVDQPAAGIFHSLADIALAPKPDTEAPLVRAAGKDGPDLLRRLRTALREAEGQRLGALCSRARAAQRPADEAVYIECAGRVPAGGPGDGLAAADPSRAPRCAALFAERDLDWLKRCGTLEAKTELEPCIEVATRHGSTRSSAISKCEADAVDRLAAALKRSR